MNDTPSNIRLVHSFIMNLETRLHRQYIESNQNRVKASKFGVQMIAVAMPLQQFLKQEFEHVHDK